MTSNNQRDNIVRFILLGSSGVGKTSILYKFCDGRFGLSSTTIGVDFKWRDIDVNGITYRLHVWDTAGQEQYKVIAKPYYRQADGAVLVYDCMSSTSLQELDQFVADARELCPLGAAMVLLGNKCDLPRTGGAAVTREQGEAFARRRGIPLFFETSAANGTCIDEAFEVLCRHALNNRRSNTMLAEVSNAPSDFRASRVTSRRQTPTAPPAGRLLVKNETDKRGETSFCCKT